MKLLLVLARFDRHKWDALTDQAWSIARLLTASGGMQCVIAAARGRDEAALEVVKDVSIRRFTPKLPHLKFMRKKPAVSCSEDNGQLPGLLLFLQKNRFDLSFSFFCLPDCSKKQFKKLVIFKKRRVALKESFSRPFSVSMLIRLRHSTAPFLINEAEKTKSLSALNQFLG